MHLNATHKSNKPMWPPNTYKIYSLSHFYFIMLLHFSNKVCLWLLNQWLLCFIYLFIFTYLFIYSFIFFRFLKRWKYLTNDNFVLDMHVKQKEGKFETIIIIIVMKNSLDSSRKKSGYLIDGPQIWQHLSFCSFLFVQASNEWFQRDMTIIKRMAAAKEWVARQPFYQTTVNFQIHNIKSSPFTTWFFWKVLPFACSFVSLRFLGFTWRHNVSVCHPLLVL